MAEVVDVVADDLVALARPVAPRVERARVARLLHDVEDVVPLDQVFVAAVDDGRVGRVVDAAGNTLKSNIILSKNRNKNNTRYIFKFTFA